MLTALSASRKEQERSTGVGREHSEHTGRSEGHLCRTRPNQCPAFSEYLSGISDVSGLVSVLPNVLNARNVQVHDRLIVTVKQRA